MPNKSTMDERSETGDKATGDIVKWLRKNKRTVDIINVEDDPRYQAQDVDLIWKSIDQEIKIEIKGDTWHKTGNFFLETHSNEEKDTLGCFLYTEADFVFYYFTEIKTLYVLPMPESRVWFEKHMGEFKEKRTQTIVGNGRYYTTVGRLVPIATLLKNVPSIKKYQLK